MARIYRGLITLTLIFALIACGGGSSSSDEQGGTLGGIGGTSAGKALLGPVVNATVKVFDIFERDKPLCQTVTTDSDSLLDAGIIHLPDNCIQDQKLYLVQVEGGMDIDADDDEVLDDVPTAVNGKFHAFVSSEQLQDNTWQVTAVSEALFQSVQNLLDLGKTEDQIRTLLEDVVPKFIAEDINGDGEINTDDILQFNPLIHFKNVTPLSEDKFRQVIDDIHLAENNTFKDVPLVDGIIGRFDTLAAATRLTINDNTAYIATKTALLLVDISTPSAPTLLGAYPSGWIYDVVVLDQTAYIALGPLGVQLVDISDPSNPEGLGRSETSDRENSDDSPQSAYRLSASNGAVFYSTERDDASTISFGVVDASDRDSPRCIELFNVDEGYAILSSFRMQDDLAIISTSSLTHSNTYLINVDRPAETSDTFSAAQASKINIDLANNAVLDVAVADIGDSKRLYFAVGQIDFFTLNFSQTLLAYDINDLNEPRPLTIDSAGVRPLALQLDQHKLLAWEESELSEIPLPLTTSGGITKNSTSILDLVDVTRATSETLISIFSRTVDNTFLISLLDDTFNFASRYHVKDGHTYIAADRYGLLIYNFPEAL